MNLRGTHQESVFFSVCSDDSEAGGLGTSLGKNMNGDSGRKCLFPRRHKGGNQIN